MNQARISIAMAVYNGERFIGEQLESLARQTRLPYELVITDDGSTDATEEIVRKFASEVPFPVKYFRNDLRLGYGDNFFAAAALCMGDLIAFCDQDDVWLDTKLDVCARSFDDPAVLLCIHSAAVVDGALRPLGEHFPLIRRSVVVGPLQTTPWTARPGFSMIMRGNLLALGDWGGRPDSHFASEKTLMPHDDFAFFIASVAGSIAFIADTLALYRQHATNTCGVPKEGTISERVLESLHAGSQKYDRLARIAGQRLAAVRSVRFEPARAGLMGEGERYYRELQAIYQMRGALYSSKAGFLLRAKYFLSLMRRNGYRCSARGGIGKRGLLKDALVGVFGLGAG